jgi:hypothetical protein
MRKADKYLAKGPVLKVLLVAAPVCLILLAAMWARVYYGSMKAYDQGKFYLDQSKHIKAVTFFDRSIHWYAPLNPYVYRSAQRLWEIGLLAEEDADIRLALIAFRTIRQGFYAARSFYTPGKDWIHRCDTKIVALTAKKIHGQPSIAKETVLTGRRKTPAPEIFWTVVLEVGFLGWLGSVTGFLAHALSGEKASWLRLKPAIFWGTLVILCFTMWIIGMVKA